MKSITTFGTTPESVELMGPDHQWEDKTTETSVSDERYCSVCEMWDCSTLARGQSPSAPKGWQVHIPCIEPVPETVEYSELMLKLVEHGITEKISYRPGLHGTWTVGLELEGGIVYPQLEASTAERGFARLLRWCRVRRYHLEWYSDYAQLKEKARLKALGRTG